MMFDPEMFGAEEMLKQHGTFVSFIVRDERLWKPFTVHRAVAVEIAPCGHEDCPAIDFVEFARGWTPYGAAEAAKKKFLKMMAEEERQREFDRQKAISEALGG